jgi:hypothetical protein
MQIATNKQVGRLTKVGAGIPLVATSMRAAEALRTVFEEWGNMSSVRCEEEADRLRALADMLDGRKTAGGKENTYSY